MFSGWRFWAAMFAGVAVGRLFGLVGAAVIFGVWWLIEYLLKKNKKA